MMPRPKKQPAEQVEELEYKLTASLLDDILKKEKHMSAQLDALNTAVAALTSKVDALITALATAQTVGSSDTAALPAITDAVNAEAAKVDAALTPAP
jgi:hypothetical protein